jgi:hypothetical protein
MFHKLCVAAVALAIAASALFPSQSVAMAGDVEWPIGRSSVRTGSR